MKPLKIYMGYDSSLGSEEAAVLIFAHSSKEARKLGWEDMKLLHNTAWTEMAVLALRRNTVALSQNADPVKLAAGEAHVVTNMSVCPNCYLFGEDGVDENGLCGYCGER
jgi:hypothetical protein